MYTFFIMSTNTVRGCLFVQRLRLLQRLKSRGIHFAGSERKMQIGSKKEMFAEVLKKKLFREGGCKVQMTRPRKCLLTKPKNWTGELKRTF